MGVEIDDELLDEILLEIYNEEVDEVSGISPTLYTANRDYFHKAIDDGIINSANAAIDLETSWIDALKHSAEVFSLHRTANQCALLAESMIDADGNLKSFEQFKKDTQAINNHYNKAWLRTEYDTAVLRTQMGADWMMFMKDADVLPNLRWMQTTSVNPREEHREFWANNLTLPIDDPFWDKHRPGDQWNCKCWLEQTDAPRTTLEDMPDSADIPEPKAGLRGNTAKTKEIFSQDHPHFPNKCASCHLNTDGKVHGIKGDKTVKNAAIKVIGNCNKCRMANNCIARIAEEGHPMTPPKLETYIEHTEGGNGVFYSPIHGKGELEANLVTAHKIANHFDTNVYLLPRIDSNKPDALQKYKEFLPKGYPFVKDGKSPDYFIFGTFYEAKCALNITEVKAPTTKLIEDKQKAKVENKIKSGKGQADNIIIELPEWIMQKAIYRATDSYFRRTNHVKSIITIQGDMVIVHKNNHLQKK